MGEKNNQNAVKHGGEGAIKRIQAQKPLIGLAAHELESVKNDLEIKGISDMVRADAIRLQAVCNLFWDAVSKAAQEGDIPALDRYVARFGWLSGVTLRAWAQVQQNEKDAAKGGAHIVDVLNAMEGGDNAKD
ncbi:MAG: hypothetical protein PHE50_02615 [Dehalococcoidales bacterium]|nr:hypothetical protein [Dehalococcoidales bacterium]